MIIRNGLFGILGEHLFYPYAFDNFL